MNKYKKNSNKLKLKYIIDTFADIKILKYFISDYENLTLKQKEYIYYLVQASLSGRDIIWDQNYKHNLKIRNLLEKIYVEYKGDRNTQDWYSFEVYLKRVWFSNGIHHHYSNIKIKPNFSKDYLNYLIYQCNIKVDDFIVDILFNNQDIKKVNLDSSKGLVELSSVNYYDDNLTTEDVENFYKTIQVDINHPIEIGLNSKLVFNTKGNIEERKWSSKGMYGKSIKNIIYWLEKALQVTENNEQFKVIELLIKYLETGDLKYWHEYNICWVKSTKGNIDFMLGFIEVYNDPMGYKGSYESIIYINDLDISKKMAIIADNAQWFENNSTIDDKFKKEKVVGISYKTVNVISEAGDASPSTPIGVNLPNSDWIRLKYGSKSISLGNIIDSYNKSSRYEMLHEFSYDDLEIKRSIKYSEISGKLHTILHEVIGHGSGKLLDGAKTPKETLKNYSNTLEEARADLVGLYFIYNPKMQELGIVNNWEDVACAEYDGFIRNGLLTQLVRIDLGDDIEEDHMRNRQLISKWAYHMGQKDNVIEYKIKDNKTYVKINDYKKLNYLFGILLQEIQRIKSTGDFTSGSNLVEKYAVKIDFKIHEEILARYLKLNLKPYKGFVNPRVIPQKNLDGEIIDFKIKYAESFAQQMLDYSKEYGFLDEEN